jgi:hypothetical protein
MGTRTGAKRSRPKTSLAPRPTCLGLGVVVVPAFSTFLTPMLGQTLVVGEIGAFLVIVSTALFGASRISERAFRFLRWCADRPEPPAPQLDTDRHETARRDR